MPLRFAFSTAVLIVTLAVVSAQQPPPPQPPAAPAPGMPTRMPPRAARPGEDPNKGTAILRGYVMATDTNSPLRRAMVRAFSQDGRSGGMTTTDGEGRFEIKELIAGRYTLQASKAGYVMMSYGQRRPEQQGTVLEVLDGQLVEKIAFSLPRGGVITGAVLDEFGEPVAGANVSALRYRYSNGARRMTPGGSGMTDDRGVFRIYGLAPGDYYVSGALRSNMMSTGNMSVGAVDGYAPTYYPGTPNAGEATRVTVRAMQEAANVSFGLIASRLSKVSGRALASNGAPLVQGMVMLSPADRMSAAGPMFSSGMTRADGTFELLGVAPGNYNLQVRPRSAAIDAEFGMARITVGQDNLENVTVIASRGGIARGIVTTDEFTPPPVRPQQVSLLARPTDPDVMMMGGGPGTVSDDWTFEITGLAEPRLITASIAENGDWVVKSVMHNGVDVTDTPIEFVPGQTVEGLEIVFSRKRTNLSGLITGDRNIPDTDATVVIFSQDSARWGFGTRYVRTARPSQDGRYSVLGLPPHDYFIVAVKDVEAGQWQDPEFLESMSRQALRVTLGEAETRVQDLKIIRP